jgi:hypothetical protein
MGRFGLILFIANIAIAAAALISCLSTEDGEVKGLPRIGWVIIILLFPLVGGIAWFVAGRGRQSAGKGGPWRPGSGFPEHQRPGRAVAPDDNPDFLRKIDRDRADLEAAKMQEQEREMLRKWEEDLRKREDDMRKQDKPEE